MKENIAKYFDEIVSHEHKDGYEITNYDKNLAKQYLSDDEVMIMILFTTMINYMNTVPNAEIIDIATECINQLKEAGSDIPINSKFIESLFNFDNVYVPLYDLLDLATNGRYKGEKMNNDYRNGIIDSIIALRKFQRFHGLGDHQWEIEYNTAVVK